MIEVRVLHLPLKLKQTDMKPKNGYKVTYIDIMVDGRFYKQMPYQYNPLWEIDTSDVEKEVLKTYPHLSNKKYKLEFSNQRILKI